MTWHRPGNKPLSEPMMVSLVYRRIYASLGPNDLMACCLLNHNPFLKVKMTPVEHQKIKWKQITFKM